MKKRPRASTASAPARPPRPRLQRQKVLQTQYKVVELSSVDEQTLEGTLNDWCRQGWTLDGIQFAMRESSKRPSMAFVLFTRQADATLSPPTSSEDARRRLERLASGPRVSAYERLRQLAGEESPSAETDE